jgi:hypothetical protein
MKKWSKDEEKYLRSLVETYGTKWTKLASEMTKHFHEVYSREQVRSRWRNYLQHEPVEIDPIKQFGVKKSRDLKTGIEEVERLVAISNMEDADDKDVLKLHGYNPSKWHLVKHEFSMWNHLNKKMENPKTLYASKVSVIPKSNEIDWDKFIERLEKRPAKEPIPFKGIPQQEPTYLEIPFFDLHFGISTLEHYENTLQETLHILEKPYKKVLFIIGQDLLHNDNFKGTTANGTIIDKVDMGKAWDDAETFYITLIDKALENSEQVTVIFSKGNHDESMSWAFVKSLQNLYRKNDRIGFDTRFKERKAHMLGLNFIGTTHGDKNRKNVAANFSIEFPEMWAKATTREVHMGHLHRKRTTKQPIEITLDDKGVIVRELGTGNATDQYHEDNGFNLAHKEFEIFEYTETRKKCIYYV